MSTPSCVHHPYIANYFSVCINWREKVRLVDPQYTGGSSDLMTHSLSAIIGDGSEFFVLPRAFGPAKIPAKFGMQMKDDELLTYSMVCGV